MATSSILENICVNNPKVLEEYVAAMEKAANAPIEKRNKKIAKEITDPEELKALMLKGMERLKQ